jgi:hypothetical protein
MREEALSRPQWCASDLDSILAELQKISMTIRRVAMAGKEEVISSK